MILEIDDQAKTIKVKGQCNMNELITWLIKQYEFEWTKWTLMQWHETLIPGSWLPIQQPYVQPGIWPQSQPGIYTDPWVGPGTAQPYIGDPNSIIITSSGTLDASGTTSSLYTGNGSNIVDDLLKKS